MRLKNLQTHSPEWRDGYATGHNAATGKGPQALVEGVSARDYLKAILRGDDTAGRDYLRSIGKAPLDAE